MTTGTLKNPRGELVDQLLGVLVESLTIELSDQLKHLLLNQQSGSWAIPHDVTSLSTSKDLTVTFHHPSLYWMWNDNKFCINFLARTGTFNIGSCQVVQWTLEGSLRAAFGADSVSSLPIQSSWKAGSLRILGVRFSELTLSGTLPLVSTSTDLTQLNLSVLTCGEVASADEFQKTSQASTQVAEAISFLNTFATPGLVWRNAPGTFGRFDSLGDVFRCASSYLDDNRGSRVMAAQSNENPPQTSTRSRINIKESITDSIVMTGGLVATGASFVTPIGALVAVASVGAKDGLVAAAKRGQDSRGGEGCKVGDVTRGITSSLHASDGIQGSRDDAPLSGDSKNGLENSSEPSTSSLPESNQHRYAGILGSSAAAAVGMAIAGPIGLMAGSVIGGAATREVLQRRTGDNDVEKPSASTSRDSPSQVSNVNPHSMYQSEEDEKAVEERGWSFGDNIRNVVRRGKEAGGRQKNDDYKFGDFTRGLFSSAK